MPRLNELQAAHESSKSVPTRLVEMAVEETLVPDQRVRRSTTQMLEDKLRRLTRYRLRTEKAH